LLFVFQRAGVSACLSVFIAMAHQQHENTSRGHYARKTDGVNDHHGMLTHRNGIVIFASLKIKKLEFVTLGYGKEHRRTGHGSFGGARPNLPEF